MAFNNDDIDVIFRKQDVAEYGNNLMYLNTFTRKDDGTTIRHNIAGILEEMPTFSNTVQWQDTALRDKVGKFINNSLNSKVYKGFEMAGMFFGNYLNPQMVEMGNYTQQVYNGTTNNSLQLRFVVPYDGIIGSQRFSTPDDIVNILLTQNTPRQEYNLGTVLNNTVAAFVATFSDVDEAKKKQEEWLELTQKMPASTVRGLRDAIYNKMISTIKSYFAKSVSEQNLKVKWEDGNTYAPQLNEISEEEVDGHKEVTVSFKIIDNNNTPHNFELLKIRMHSDKEIDNFYSYQSETLKKLYKNIEGASDKALKKFVRYSGYKNSDEIGDMSKEIVVLAVVTINDNLYKQEDKSMHKVYENIRKSINKENVGTTATFQQVDSNILGKLETTAQNMFVGVFPGDATRAVSVSNATTVALGIKLWNLQIYSGLFKRHFVGFISNVNIKPSKELIGNVPAYTEFNLTFDFDRTMSADVYLSKLANYNENRLKKIKTQNLGDTESSSMALST